MSSDSSRLYLHPRHNGNNENVVFGITDVSLAVYDENLYRKSEEIEFMSLSIRCEGWKSSNTRGWSECWRFGMVRSVSVEPRYSTVPENWTVSSLLGPNRIIRTLTREEMVGPVGRLHYYPDGVSGTGVSSGDTEGLSVLVGAKL